MVRIALPPRPVACSLCEQMVRCNTQEGQTSTCLSQIAGTPLPQASTVACVRFTFVLHKFTGHDPCRLVWLEEHCTLLVEGVDGVSVIAATVHQLEPNVTEEQVQLPCFSESG
jgi:hypothetical protein